MTSKYDGFWRECTDALISLTTEAADGGSSSANLSAIRTLGERASWAGTVAVCGTVLLRSSMAHMTSLGNLVVATGICSSWPEITFVFSMNPAGFLTVKRSGAAETPSHRVERPRALLAAPAPETSDNESLPMDPTEACGRIHSQLDRLPRYSEPSQVPFTNGLYFFFERGEDSAHGHPRITRVGNHPLAQGRLMGRLREHYRTSPNQKNGSVFRRYLGGALLRRDEQLGCLAPGPGLGHWESGTGHECDQCAPYEGRVTERLHAAFTFACVEIEQQDQRNEFERRLIGAVAQCRTCHPTAEWLGAHAYPPEVRRSGLWNVQHVGEAPPSSELLVKFAGLVNESRADTDLSDALLLIPCSARKRGEGDLGPAPVSIGAFLGERANAVLQEGRSLAFDRASLDGGSLPRPALALYNGQPYRTPGFVQAVLAAMARGMHVLIVSGGYGLVRAEEPIQVYEAPMPKTLTVWRPRVLPILRDYVERNTIRRTFGAFSRVYSTAVPEHLTEEDWRAVPTLEDVNGGPAMVRIPQRVASLTLELLQSNLEPGAGWTRTA